MALLIIALTASGVSTAAIAGKAANDAKKLLKHQETKISSADSIQSGDHISYKTSWTHDHHVVVESVNRDGDKTELKVFGVTGTRDKAIVSNEVVNIQQFLVKGQVLQHTYNEAVGLMYNAVNIIERARYLWTEFHASLSKLEPPLKDCEDFATWCQIGMTYTEVLHARMGTINNSVTPVKTVNDIGKGDHISYKSSITHYHHAIIVDTDNQSLQSLKLLHMKHDKGKSVCREELSVTKLIQNGKLRRHNYNLSIYPKGEITAERAISCTDETIKAFSNCEEFATWCYFERKMSYQEVESLGMARMLGRLHTKVEFFAELSKGDHVAWFTSLMSNMAFIPQLHHAIVVKMKETTQTLSVVHFASSKNTCHTIRQNRNVHIVVEDIEIKKMIKKGKIFKFLYNPSTSFPNQEAAKKAKKYLTEATAVQRFGNCEHFATSCKSDEANWGFGFGMTTQCLIANPEDEIAVPEEIIADSIDEDISQEEITRIE